LMNHLDKYVALACSIAWIWIPRTQHHHFIQSPAVSKT
jgi:hypothetical protein